MRDYTYIGIGSKNRTDKLEDFTVDMDQIIPCFLNEIKDRTIRIINFDPQFENNFLDKYFVSKGFDKQEDGVWMTPDNRIEALIIPRQVDTDSAFLRDMISVTIKHNKKLVVQMYTGRELSPIFRNLYFKFLDSEKQYIRENVLFDITYGEEGHCLTPMSQHSPMLDPNGNFYNFILYNEEQMLESIGLLPKMDRLIEAYVMKKLSKILNENHVNYRKSVRGEPLLFDSVHYGIFAKPEKIMGVLLRETKEVLNILAKLGSLSKEKQDLFNECSKNYNEVDMYRWYSDMTKLYK